MGNLSNIRTKRRKLVLRWILPTVIVALVIIGRLFFFVYKQPTPQGLHYHLMSRIAEPHRGDQVLLSSHPDDLQLERHKHHIVTDLLKSHNYALLKVIGESGDTLRFEGGMLSISGPYGAQTFMMPLPTPLQQGSYMIILDQDEYWLLATSGETTDAIDSRHLGAISRTQISATAIW